MGCKTATQSTSGKGIRSLVRIAYVCAYQLQLMWNYVFRPFHFRVWVAVWAEDKLLLIGNGCRDSITLPGGGRDMDEFPLEAL